jgi:hypothetical protein
MGESDLKLRTKEYALGNLPFKKWDGMGGLLLNNDLNGAKRLNGWNDWNGIHCEQGIFVAIVRNTKAKSKPLKSS